MTTCVRRDEYEYRIYRNYPIRFKGRRRDAPVLSNGCLLHLQSLVP